MAYINREKFIKECAKTFGNPSMTLYAINNIANECVADVEEVRHGEWIWTENGEEDYEQFWVCSVCKEKSYIETKFCSDCGAKMDGGKDENV